MVDDNPINLMVAKKLIQQLGHEVVTAEDGLLAIQAWQNEQPEMIFMDLQMPQMDGLDATREIEKSSPTKADPPLASWRSPQTPSHRRRKTPWTLGWTMCW